MTIEIFGFPLIDDYKLNSSLWTPIHDDFLTNANAMHKTLL
jgi:hypothetical protein